MSWFKNIFGGKEEADGPEPVRNRPVSPEALVKLEADLGVKLPAGLGRMYAVNDGVELKERNPVEVLRLMPLKEVREIHAHYLKTGVAALFKRYAMVCFWADDNARYAGMFCSGFLEGRIFFLDHNGPFAGDVSPVFRSVESFLETLTEAAERNRIIGYFESGDITYDALTAHASRFPDYRHGAPGDKSTFASLPLDYRSPPECYVAGDRAAYAECRQRLEANVFTTEGEREFLIYSLARLVPPDEVASLLNYLKEDHMWVPARVARILIQRECPEAIHDLVTLALAGNFNCRSSVKCTLARMIVQTPEVQGAIKAEYSRLGGDFAEIRANLQAQMNSPSLFYQW